MRDFISRNKHLFNWTNIIIFLLSILELSYIYVLSRTTVSKQIILFFVFPLLMFNTYFIDYFKKNKLNFENNKKEIGYYILIFVLSLILCKSINISVLNLSQGILSIPSSLGLVLFSFQFVVIISLLIEKTNLEPRTTLHNKYGLLFYAIPSAIVFTFLYLTYFPGIVSADSLKIWNDVGINSYTDTHPLIYMILLKGLRLLWNDIAVVTLFNIIVCSFTFAFIANELDKMHFPKFLCWAVAVVLPLFPANALYAVTVWKDVPYTMGLLILSILIFKSVNTDYYYSKIAFIEIFIVSLFTLFVRHNALFSVFLSLLFLGIYWIYKKDKKLIIKTLILGFSLIVAFFGTKTIVISSLSTPSTQQSSTEESPKTTEGEYSGNSMIHLSYPTVIARQQIIYTQHVEGDSFSKEENELFHSFFNIEGVNAHKEKYAAYDIWMYYNISTNMFNPTRSRQDLWSLYFKLWRSFPKSMMMGYEKITSILWASSSYGSVAYRGYTDINYDFLEKYEFRPILPDSVYSKLDSSVFSYVDSSLGAVFWRPALALVFSLILMLILYRKKGIGAVFILMPVLFNQLTYFIIIASQDTRYTYINYSIFVVMLALTLMKKDDKISKLNE